MKNIADHLLDIAQNSIDAQAKQIVIDLKFTESNFILSIKDNGEGMNTTSLQKATDPFFTTRTTRKVGMGLALLQHNCETTGGSLQIHSKVGQDTNLQAIMQTTSIDMIPKGDIAAAISMIICNNKEINICFSYQDKKSKFKIDSKEIRTALHPIALDHIEIRKGIKKLISESINSN